MKMLLSVPLAAVLALVGLDVTVAFADSPQTHHCKLADDSVDAKKTHKECTAAKGEWAADAPAAAPPVPAPAPAKPTTPVGDNTQDHHCRLPDKSMDMKKTHKECEAAKGQWAKDANPKATPPAHAP